MVDQGQPVMRLIEILRKKPKESNYHTLLNWGQFAARGFTHWWWSNRQKKFMMIFFRGLRTDLFTKTFA